MVRYSVFVARLVVCQVAIGHANRFRASGSEQPEPRHEQHNCQGGKPRAVSVCPHSYDSYSLPPTWPTGPAMAGLVQAHPRLWLAWGNGSSSLRAACAACCLFEVPVVLHEAGRRGIGGLRKTIGERFEFREDLGKRAAPPKAACT